MLTWKGLPQLARRYHPDVSKDGLTPLPHGRGERGRVLSDPKGAAYDRLGQAAPPLGQDFPPAAQLGRRFEFTGALAPIGRRRIQPDFFGGSSAAPPAPTCPGPSGAQARRAPPPQRGRDHHASIELDLRDAYHGGQAAADPTARGWTRPGIWSTNGASCR